jgi:glycosyltransferase involved in cell wall biosynthesis
MQQTPVIVRNIGGMPEIIQESGGFAYDADQQLLMAMDGLLSDAAYRNRLGANGYRALKQKWTADAHLKSFSIN